MRLRSVETSPSGWKRRQHHLERAKKIDLRVSNLSWREPFRILCGGCVVEFGGRGDLKGSLDVEVSQRASRKKKFWGCEKVGSQTVGRGVEQLAAGWRLSGHLSPSVRLHFALVCQNFTDNTLFSSSTRKRSVS